MKIKNEKARPLTLNLMVEGEAVKVALLPDKTTHIKDKTVANAVKNDPYFKANVDAKNLTIVGNPKASNDYVFTSAKELLTLDGGIPVIKQQAKFLTVDQLQEALSLEESMEAPRGTLVTAFNKMIDKLAEEE